VAKFLFVHCTISVLEFNQMSLINLFVAARNAMARRQRQRRAIDELLALDDRSLADIGIHRSQIMGAADRFSAPSPAEAVPHGVSASAFDRGTPGLARGRQWLPHA
jgi:uncharacterized protein YjiS (DUF1127 family)